MRLVIFNEIITFQNLVFLYKYIDQLYYMPYLLISMLTIIVQIHYIGNKTSYNIIIKLLKN